MTNASLSCGLSFRVPVHSWAAWPASDPPRAAGGQPFDLAFVEPLLRRRLGRLARMMLHVAHACAAGLPRLRTVFASRHGELNTTVTLLRDLARRETLSPTAFSLSVHNAAAGVFSIARADRSPATAIAAGEETLAYALLEAWCQWHADPDSPVLMVYADEPLPEEYRPFADPQETAHAIGVLLAREAPRSIEVSAAARGELTTTSAIPQSLAFLQCLARGDAGTWTGSRRIWRWG